MDHLRTNGFTVKPEDTNELQPVKKKHGVPAQLSSCHTGIVDGYVIEGHVPADLIHRLLKQRPAVVGLAVPGMPVGSPGMEAPGQKAEPYKILTFDKGGKTTIYETR